MIGQVFCVRRPNADVDNANTAILVVAMMQRWHLNTLAT
jgi:hypothetical protein